MCTDRERQFSLDSPTGEPWRSPAQIDADRISYAPEFRRLSGVTQVVPPQRGHHFHDRLSHSLKVAQVAATLARQLLFRESNGGGVPSPVDVSNWVDPDYCYVAGLAHDIGHPPFGHAGEQVLQQILNGSRTDESGDLQIVERSFEGNAQSTRIVATLSFRKDDDQRGLNLTLRSLAAIAKYPWLRGKHPYRLKEKLEKKWSFYPEEASILERLEERGYISVERMPDGRILRVHRWPEAEIMDWADDITYAVHDLEDFSIAGITPLYRIHAALSSAPSRVNWATTDFDFVEDDEIRGCLQFITEKLKHITGSEAQSMEVYLSTMWKELHASLLKHFPRGPYTGTRSSHAQLQKFASALISYLSDAASLNYEQPQMRVALAIRPSAILLAEFFKALNRFFVIGTTSLTVMQHGQGEDIRFLHTSLTALSRNWVAEFTKEDVDLDTYMRVHRTLPARLREYLRTSLTETPRVESEAKEVSSESGDPDEAAPRFTANDDVAVAVVDYICSLTDAQAALLCAQLRSAMDPAVMTADWLDD